jgi:hypothetical protein
MKTRFPWTLAALAAFAAAGGFLVGRISKPDAPATARDAEEAAEASVRRSGTGREGADRMVSTDRKERGSSRRTGSSSQGADAATRRLERMQDIVMSEDPVERVRSLTDLLATVAPSEFTALVEQFSDMGIGDIRRGEYAMILAAWAKVDPVAALSHVQETGGERFASNTVLATWASNDPASALRWAEANHSGDAPNPHLAGIIRGLAATDFPQAESLLRGMPRSVERAEALDGFLPHLLAKGTDAAKAWTDGLDDASLKNGTMMRLAERLARVDPPGTVSWLLTNPSEATDRSMDDVYRIWAGKDQKAALESLDTLPAGEPRGDALRGLVTSMARRDPAEAVGLMDRYPTELNDRTVQSFIWHSFDKDPGIALDQAARLTDQGSRERMYRRGLGAWMDRDAAAASSWMTRNSSALPQSVIDHVNRRSQRQ